MMPIPLRANTLAAIVSAATHGVRFSGFSPSSCPGAWCYSDAGCTMSLRRLGERLPCRRPRWGVGLI